MFVCVSLQGDSADCMYFVEDGEVRITVRNMVSVSSTFHNYIPKML